jgi:Leucine-rich repeat (LRR) protein
MKTESVTEFPSIIRGKLTLIKRMSLLFMCRMPSFSEHFHIIKRQKIPASLGKLSCLESLDLSSNKLTGEIPMQLANGLIFLSVLNLSFNQLVGQIPFIKQFATFQKIHSKEMKYNVVSL